MEEKQKGKTIKVGYRKLTIDGQELRWKEGEGLRKEENFGIKKKLRDSLTRWKTQEQEGGSAACILSEKVDGAKARGLKICIWKGLMNKDKQFWEFIKEYDVVGLIETWIEDKIWKKIIDTLPKELKWECQLARREKTKGRAIGSIITGVKNHIEEAPTPAEEEGIMERRLTRRREVWRIISIYSREMEKTKKKLEKMLSETDSRKIIIGGDWNARIGEDGTDNWGEEEDGRRRRSKDKVKNEEGKKMMEMVEENGWCILNRNTEGDKEGEWTYLGPRDSSVIDYAVVSAITKRDIIEFKVEERIESVHMPIRIEVEMPQEPEQSVEKRKWKELRLWTEEAVQQYREETERLEFKEESINEMMKEISEKLHKAVRKKKVREWKIVWNRWWDQECTRKKREARKALRKWKKGKGQRTEYIQKRKL